MRAVYRNPRELATKLKDVIDLYLEDLLSYEKLEATVVAMIKTNDDRIPAHPGRCGSRSRLSWRNFISFLFNPVS